MRRPAHLIPAVVAAVAALLSGPLVALGEECEQLSTISAVQAGQAVLVNATVVIHSGGQASLEATRSVVREGPVDTVATPFTVTLEECTNPTAPPEYCDCLMGSIAFREECVRPGPYLYRLDGSEAEAAVDVNDTGHDCLGDLDEVVPEPTDEVRPGCSVAAARPTERSWRSVLAAAALLWLAATWVFRHRN